jgi:GPH family glycoside/pentoside/hexuronide:cation symporter
MQTERLSWREKFGYGLGDFALHMSWDRIAGFLLFFYTGVAGIAIAAAGARMLVSQVPDAAADPLAGALVDRTRSRYGKARSARSFTRRRLCHAAAGRRPQPLPA